ncbi:hypothetical protein [Alloactinosynnema sp. L-07]|nr:hypothetical protein [Alloactinosynnema sp. L-07]
MAWVFFDLLGTSTVFAADRQRPALDSRAVRLTLPCGSSA